MDNSKLASTQGSARTKCDQALSHLDWEPAQVYATLSVEEALRDLAAAIKDAADQIGRASRTSGRCLDAV